MNGRLRSLPARLVFRDTHPYSPANVDSRTRSNHPVICTRQSPEARRESLDSRLCWEVGGGNPKPSRSPPAEFTPSVAMQPPFHDGDVKQPGEAALGVAPCRLAELAEDPVLRLGPERPRHVQQSFP